MNIGRKHVRRLIQRGQAPVTLQIPLPTEKQTIYLVGAPGSGCTGLLATLRRSLEFETHGLREDLRFSLDGDSNSQLDAISKTFTHRLAGTNGGALPPSVILKLRIDQLAASGSAAANVAKSHTLDIEIFECRSSLNVGVDVHPGKRDFDQSGTDVDAVILCKPALDLANRPWSSQYLSVCNRLADAAAFPKLKTVVVALTQFDLAFAAAGTSAFEQSLSYEVVLDLIVHGISCDVDFLTGLRLLTSRSSARSPDGLDIYLLPVSSFGFLADNGAANVDLWSGLPLIWPSLDGSENNASALVRGWPYADAQQLTDALVQSWCPYLAADSVIMAATKPPNFSQFDRLESVMAMPLDTLLDLLPARR